MDDVLAIDLFTNGGEYGFNTDPDDGAGRRSRRAGPEHDVPQGIPARSSKQQPIPDGGLGRGRRAARSPGKSRHHAGTGRREQVNQPTPSVT